jgi:hypothetical protein
MEFQLGSHSVVEEEEKNTISTCQRARSQNAALPFDILGLIFHHVADGHPINLRSLLFVCRSWYDAVWLHPTLWSTIWIDHTLLTVLASNGALKKQLIEHYLHCCLRRSGVASLDISLDLKPHQISSISGNKHDILLYLLSLVAVLIGQDHEHAARWRSFTWRWRTTEHFSQIFSKLPSILPALETLRLRGLILDERHISTFPRCPRLRTVELHQYTLQPLHFADCLLVSELVISTDVAWLSSDLIVLSQFRNIRHLTLYTTMNQSSTFTSESYVVLPSEILLPHLHYLHLRGHLPSQMIGRLLTPSLKELVLDCYSTFELLGNTWLTRTLETIYMGFPDLDPNLPIHMHKDVKKLLDVAPALKFCMPK